MFDRPTRLMLQQAGQIHDLDPAALAAIGQVESAGITGTMINGRFEPLIRFEGHYFDRRLTPAQQVQARADNLASPKAGAILNPATQLGRWQLLTRACKINADAAYESTSWGIGQVMGAHWHWLGYASVADLTEQVRASVMGQIELMTRYLVYSNLRSALNSHNWQEIALRYNGPAYAKNRYDSKLAQAFNLYQPLFATS